MPLIEVGIGVGASGSRLVDDTAGAAFAQQFKDMGWTEEAASDMGEFKTWVYFDSASSLVVSISQLGGEGVAPRLTYSVSPRT